MKNVSYEDDIMFDGESSAMSTMSQDYVSMENLSLQNLGVHMIFDDIDEVSSYKTCQFLLKSNIVLSRNDFVTLYINSAGGYCTDGFAIIDMMQASRVKVATRAIGMIESMGFAIFVAGHKGYRTMAPNCEVMSHQFSGGMHGKSHELMAIRKNHDDLHNKFVKLFVEQTTMTKKQVEDIIFGPSDCYLTPKECLKYGICDRVSSPWEAEDRAATTKRKPK
jgi:ATP-dependent Clp protease, protease subunit